MGGNAVHGTEEHGHIIPYRIYVQVLVTLLILTVVTVVVAKFEAFNFGNWNIVIALLIASVKAGIVGMFFMHLKYENPLIWIYVTFPIVLLIIMLGGILSDNPSRWDSKIYSDQPIKKDLSHSALSQSAMGH